MLPSAKAKFESLPPIPVKGKKGSWWPDEAFGRIAIAFSAQVGENVVIATLKNTLGPHHGNPPLGSAWPGMFPPCAKARLPPGSQYSTVGYGLFEPFRLKEASGVKEVTRVPSSYHSGPGRRSLVSPFISCW
jgi:hypothetical protein